MPSASELPDPSNATDRLLTDEVNDATGATFAATETAFVTTLEARPWLSLTVSFTEYVFTDAYV